MSGYYVARVVIPGIIDYTFEDSNKESLDASIAKTNAMLRFKHKILKPAWDIQKIGEPGKKPRKPEVRPSRNDAAADEKPARPTRKDT